MSTMTMPESTVTLDRTKTAATQADGRAPEQAHGSGWCQEAGDPQ